MLFSAGSDVEADVGEKSSEFDNEELPTVNNAILKAYSRSKRETVADSCPDSIDNRGSVHADRSGGVRISKPKQDLHSILQQTDSLMRSIAAKPLQAAGPSAARASNRPRGG